MLIYAFPGGTVGWMGSWALEESHLPVPGVNGRDMAAGEVARLREELGAVLFDPDASATPELVAVPVTATLNDAQNRLEKYFRTLGAADAVTLVVAGERLGVVSRKSLGPPGMTVGDPGTASYEVGSGERLALPGLSTRYKLLKFRCRQCSAETFGMHYDTRGLSTCVRGHRKWELQRED
jgi:hypothetical protein